MRPRRLHDALPLYWPGMPDIPDTLSPALAAALQRFNGHVQSIARRYGIAPEEREELVQEVRIRLWRALATEDRISGVPASYVYRAAISAAVDLIRRQRARREVYVDHGRPSGEAVFGRSELEDLPERGELAERVAASVDQLLDSRRPVVRMYLAGYKLEEIAALLGWTAARTRNLLYRGLGDLRELLQRQGIGPQGDQP